ncbi:MAG: hypothetical protein QOH40_1617, partial [Arthrobacter pascens]|nr:hypothetical protein [Arthrobacter pascens]
AGTAYDVRTVSFSEVAFWARPYVISPGAAAGRTGPWAAGCQVLLAPSMPVVVWQLLYS